MKDYGHQENSPVHRVVDKDNKFLGYMIFCPACKSGHHFDLRWTFNGNFEKPTFRASMLSRGTVPLTDDEYDRVMAGEKIEPKPLRCHSFVTDGYIEYLSDCSHEYKNKKIKLETF